MSFASSFTTTISVSTGDIRVTVEYLYHGPVDAYCEVREVVDQDGMNIVDALDNETVAGLSAKALDAYNEAPGTS